jgi:ubiquinone/menaquinone biosynthesis C-methylase UbiE
MRPPALPQMTTERVAAGFTQAADRYDTDGGGFFTEMGGRLAALAGVGPGAQVLDVGCGKGAVTVPAARLAGEHGRVHAIDLAAPMVAATAARARTLGLATVTAQAGDAGDPSTYPAWSPQSFDVVLAGYVIQFLPRPDLAVRRWWSLLKPGGTVGLSWGLAQDPRWVPVMAAVDAHVPDGVPGFEAYFRRPPFTSTGPLEQMLTGHGYQAVDTVTYQVETVYASPGQWWAACRSQGPWAISWRHIPPAQLKVALADAFTALEDLRGPDRTLTRTLTLAITTAIRPQAAPG